MAEPIHITTLDDRQLQPAGVSLAEAFEEDPLFVYLAPDAGRRRRWLASLLSANLRKLVREGCVWSVGSAPSGVIGAVPPHGGDPELGGELRFFTRLVGAPWGPTRWRRVGRFLAAGSRLLRVRPVEPFWYVDILGVRPEQAGRGVGAALLGQVLDHADADRVPTYLETSNPQNRAYYSRFGFVQTGEVVIASGGPSVWTMVRRPNG